MNSTTSSRRRRRILLAAVATALTALASLVVVNAPAQADAPAPEDRTVRYEVDIMTDMIDHHHMAIMMSSMCLDSRHHWMAVTQAERCAETAYHDELVAMCGDIIAVQLAEIEQMQTWLCDWYNRCGGRPTKTV